MVGKVVHREMEVKSATEEESLLDGVDLDGVSEEERAQIKQAILASKEDQHFPRRRRKEKRAVSTDDDKDQGGCAESDAVVAESTEDDDADTQEPAVKVNGDKGTSEMSEAGSEPETNEPGVLTDDDETQPPSQEIEEENEEENDLSKSTQLMADEVSAYQMNTDIDEDPNKSQISEDLDSSPPPQNVQAVPSPEVAMDTSQGSGGFSPQPEGSKSTGSQGSQDQGPDHDDLRLRKSKSNSQGDDGEQTAGQLHRHYRAVRRKAAPRDQYYRVEGMSTEQCAKAIYQLFETYRTKLRDAQRRLYPTLGLGDPIKTGQHLSRTIDFKKRGQTSVYLEVSDDEGDVEMAEIKSSRRQRKAVSNSDDDFENEIIKPRRRGRKSTYQSDDELQTKRNNRYKSIVDEEFMSVETQEYDVGQSASTSDMKTVEDPGSLRRRLRNRKAKVLVEDTQLPELSERDYRAGTQSQFIVEETQEAEDDLIDYLSVKKDNHARKQTFENPMQQAKLKGYAIPMRKKESSEGKGKSHMQQDGKREHVQRSGSHESVGEDNERKETTARGRPRKGKKEPVTLVEETQDMMDDLHNKANSKAGVRQKRKCFSLSSDSEDESVPETQGIEGSPEVVIIEEKTSPKMRKTTTEKAKVFTATLIRNMVPKDESADIDDPDSDKDSQSPVIKRSSRFKNKPVQNAVPKKKSVTIDENNLHGQLGEVKDETEQAGVKRLFSRPQSRESAASDDVSVASSQISNTALDECGDLYSTQIFGVGQNVGNDKRDVNQNVKIRPEKSDKMKRFDEILDSESDEEVLIVKEVKKTFSKKVPNIGHTRREATKHKTSQNESSISKYFTSGKMQDDDQRNVRHKKHDPVHLVDVNVNQNDTDSDEDPLSSEARANVHNHPVKTIGSRKVPSVELKDIKYITVKKDQGSLNERGKNAKSKQDIYGNEDQPPISLNDFTRQEMHRSAAADKALGGARPKTKRQRKPETMTIIDDEPDVLQRHRETGPHVGVADNIVGGARRRGRRARHEEEEEEEEEPIPKAAKMEEATIQCPLCGVKFAASVIEQHASNCDGTPPDEEATADAGNQPRGNRNQGMTREADEMSDENPLMGDDSPMRVNDTSMDDVLRDIRSSPGENGEVEQCYICDQYINKGREFQQHLNQCMQRAKQQQEEVDSKGFVEAFQLPDEPEPEIRQTRGRNRHNKDVPAAVPIIVKPTRGVVRGTGRGVTHTATRGQKEDGYSSGPSVTKESSESESETGSSSCEEGSSSNFGSEDDDNITLGSLARAGSSSLVTGPRNGRPVYPQTQSDGSNPIPDWLKRSADSPIKSFVPTSMQQNSEYFNKQFAYNEKRVAERQKKRKRKVGKPKRRKRRKVRRKKKTN